MKIIPTQIHSMVVVSATSARKPPDSLCDCRIMFRHDLTSNTHVLVCATAISSLEPGKRSKQRDPYGKAIKMKDVLFLTHSEGNI